MGIGFLFFQQLENQLLEISEIKFTLGRKNAQSFLKFCL